MNRRYALRETVLATADRELVGYPTFLSHLLYHRGIATAAAAEKFLNPDYERDTNDPFLLKGMDRAVERVLRAVRDGEHTVIYSDYDSDGIPGGVILHDFFKRIGYENFENYIPHRAIEGFGLHAAAIEEFARKGSKLLITVDCGIADAEEVAQANRRGMDVIVTDHHVPLPTGLPPASAVVDPTQEGCAYPEKMLCGAGVAFKLVEALLAAMRQKRSTHDAVLPAEGWEKWLLDLVGLATISDMMPLTGENRVLTRFGLVVLRKSPRVGLKKLLKLLRVPQGELTEDDVGFLITPRINAASRMGEPRDAFNLLATGHEGEAETLAFRLNHLNDERKGVVAAMVKDIRHLLRSRLGERPRNVVVLGNPKWKPALLGLAANAVVAEEARPVFLWGMENDRVFKGSCRSDGSVNLLSLMQGAKETFVEFGGHSLSGGFTVAFDNIHLLESELERAYEKVRGERCPREPTWIDASLSLEDVTWETQAQLEKLSPFGVGNPKPMFLFEGVSVQSVRRFGKDDAHLELWFEKKSKETVRAVCFFADRERFPEPLPGRRINLIATLERSTFRNYPELLLRMIDVV